MRLVYADSARYNQNRPLHWHNQWQCMLLTDNTQYVKCEPVPYFQYEDVMFNKQVNLACMREFFYDQFGHMFQRLLVVDFSSTYFIRYFNKMYAIREIGALTAYGYYCADIESAIPLNMGYDCALNFADPKYSTPAYKNCFQAFMAPFMPTIPQPMQIISSAQISTMHLIIDPETTPKLPATSEPIVPFVETLPATASEVLAAVPEITTPAKDVPEIAAPTVQEAQSVPTTSTIEQVNSETVTQNAQQEKNSICDKLAENVASKLLVNTQIAKQLNVDAASKPETMVERIFTNSIATSTSKRKKPVSNVNDAKISAPMSNVKHAKTPASKSKRRAEPKSLKNAASDITEDAFNALIAEVSNTAPNQTLNIIAAHKNNAMLSAFKAYTTRTIAMCKQVELTADVALLIADLCVIYGMALLHNRNNEAYQQDAKEFYYGFLKFAFDCFLAVSLLNLSVHVYKKLVNQ